MNEVAKASKLGLSMFSLMVNRKRLDPAMKIEDYLADNQNNLDTFLIEHLGGPLSDYLHAFTKYSLTISPVHLDAIIEKFKENRRVSPEVSFCTDYLSNLRMEHIENLIEQNL